jgi:hypothetical protein
MPTVAINPPKTPVTKGSNGVAAATVPNVCKMPGPPAPFVPAPLPNIGKSGDSPKGYSKNVKIEGNAVAVKGATFKSTGDMASKGTGGGLVSANTHGITKFVGLGSLDTKIEGKNVQLLGDPMLNNCGPSGSPPNAATLAGLVQAPKPKEPGCTHGNIERQPAEDEMGFHDKEKPGDGDKQKTAAKIEQDKQKLERMKARQGKVSEEKAPKLRQDIAGLESNIAGAEWELLVAEDVDAKAMGVKLVCKDCGEVLGEFDIIMDDGTVKECKSDWDTMTESKFIKQMELVEQRGLLGPGKTMHFAIPKGARAGGRLDRKFPKIGKDAMRGRIQEH